MEGIIYKVQPYQESSKLLFVYTKIGKITLVAKGVQKINSNERILSQYLTKISFKETTDKLIYPLKDAKIINDYQKIKDDYQSVKDASIILDIINYLTLSNENHESLYNEIIDALDTKDVSLSSLSFALKMLIPLGVGLNLKANGNRIKGYNINNSSIVYYNEKTPIDIDTKDLTIVLKLIYLPYDNLESIGDINIRNIKEFIYKYYLYHLNINLKTLDIKI